MPKRQGGKELKLRIVVAFPAGRIILAMLLEISIEPSGFRL